MTPDVKPRPHRVALISSLSPLPHPGPTPLAAECCAHVQAGKQNILNLLVKVTKTGVSQHREAALPSERAILDRNTPWYNVVGAGSHWP